MKRFCLQGVGDDWPMLQHDPQRTAFTPEEVPPPYTLLWRKDLGEPASGYQGVVLCKDRVFIGTHLGRLYALDARNGNRLWRFQAEAGIVREPACGDELVYVASLDRHIYALEQPTGKLRWSFECEGGVWCSPLLFKGRVLLGDRSGAFYSINARTGRLLWKFTTGGPVLASASASEDRVFFASEDMFAYALSVTDGKLLWRTKLHGRTARDYFPVVNGNMVVFTVMPIHAASRVG